MPSSSNDVRINQVTTDVNVTDAKAMLSPPVMERIVRAVLQQLEEKQRSDRASADEQRLGSARRAETDTP